MLQKLRPLPRRWWHRRANGCRPEMGALKHMFSELLHTVDKKNMKAANMWSTSSLSAWNCMQRASKR